MGVPAGWDRPTDREKDPAVVPDPAETAVPDDLRAALGGLLRISRPRSTA
jgi:hypothetical protein